MSADTSAATQPDANPTRCKWCGKAHPTKDHDLFVIGSCAAKVAHYSRILTRAQFALFCNIWELQQASPNGLRISARQLAKACNISKSNMLPAIRALTELCILTWRKGGTTDKSFYRVCAFDTIAMGGPVLGPPQPETVVLFQDHRPPQVVLFQDQGGPILGPPPIEEQRLAAAAAALDLDVDSLRLINRVLMGKPQDHDQGDLAHFRARLHAYFQTFGRDDRGKPLHNPHPPPNEVVAQFLSIAPPDRLSTMLSNLEIDAVAANAHHPATRSALNPYNYGWFTIIGLSRVHGIHFQVQRKARAALRDVKRRPAPPQPEQIELPDIAALAAKKAMR
jgi:hypothetical protein